MMNCVYIPPDTSYIGSGGWVWDSHGNAMKEKAGLMTEDYRLTLEAIQQGKTFAERGSDIYRENRMAENFIREFDALDGESVMGIYGAAHTDPDAMADSAGTVPSMAAQLVERYGDSLHTEDISWIAWEPQRTDTLTVAGKEYQASYFGEEDISGWAGDYQSRAFWRLEGAYEDFEDCPESSDVLPCNDYPMPIEAGQVFVLGYTRKDGTSERKYYRSDGEVWNGMDCTTEFIPE